MHSVGGTYDKTRKNMRKILSLFAALVFSSVAIGQVTPNLNLNIPVANTPNWGTLLNNNFGTLDALLSGVTALPALNVTGPAILPELQTWQTGTTYSTGEVVAYHGIFYSSIAGGNVGNLPTNTSFWSTSFGGAVGTLLAANNLSDLASASTARTNLGLGTAATQPSTAFAFTANPLSQFAATTSAQLASVLSDETGSGPAVFANGSSINPASIGITTPAKVINGISYAQAYTGATVAEQVNSCMSDALHLTNGNTTHICDASALGGANVTDTQINAGDSAGDLYKLILPALGNWSGSMTDGTSCTLAQYGGGSIIGASTASGVPGLFYIGAGATSNLGYVFCTKTQTGNNQYLFDQGFSIVNENAGSFVGHATANNIGAYINGPFYDQTTFDHVGFTDNLDTYDAYITGMCCNTTFRNSEFNGNYGSIPAYITSSTAVSFDHSNFVHPLGGSPTFECTGSSIVSVDDAYTETSNANTSETIYYDNGCSRFAMSNVTVKAYVSGMSAPGLTVANTAGSQVIVDGLSMVNGSGDFFYPATAVVNNLTGQTVQTDSVGNLPRYDSAQTGSGGTVHATGAAIAPATVAATTSITSPLINNLTTVSSSGAILATESKTSAGTPTRIEIYPNSTAKPDEGNASVSGTVAWAAAQLSSGGEIFVHEGAYTIATTITLATAGTHLICADPAATTFTAGSSLNANLVDLGFQGAQRQGIMVENCGFNGNNGQNTSGNLIEARDVANAIIQNNYLKDSVTTGLTLDATTSGEVQNQIVGNFFVECVNQCLAITSANGGDPTDTVVDRNTIGGSVIGNGTNPWVTVADLGGEQFTNNHISGPGHTYSAYFSNGSQSHVVISHNIFESSVQHGLVVNGEAFTITGNMFYLNGTGTANTYADLYLMSSSNDSITGNVFDGSSNNKYGIYSDQGTIYNTISGNTFLNHTSYAISLANAFAGGNVIGTNIYNGNGGTINAGGAHYAPTAVPVSNSPALSSVPGQLNTNGIATAQLASGPTPTITTSGTAGAATWSYVIAPKDINGQASAAGSAGSTTTGNATLSGSNFNVAAWTIVNGAYSYDVYRTAVGSSPTTTGFIGNVLSTATPSGNGSMFLNDTALAGNGAAPPSVNTTGSASFAGPVTVPPAASGTTGGQSVGYFINTASPKYGTVPDAHTLEDGAMTSGSAVLTDASGFYTAGDVGKTIIVNGAGSTASSTTLTTALTIAATTTLAVSALPAAVPAGWVIVTSGANTQMFTTAGANSGATSIAIDSTTPTFAFPIGSTVVTPALPLVTNIASYQSATQVTLAANASKTVAPGGVYSATYVSGTLGGTGSVSLSSFNNSCSGTTATLYVAGGVAGNLVITAQGSGCTAPPTSATCANGTGGTCSGTFTLTSVLQGAEVVYGTDNYAGLTAAVADAASSKLPLFIAPGGTTGDGYLYNGTLTLAANVDIIGGGNHKIVGSYIPSNQNADNFPTVAPYLTGSVLIEAGQGIDAINITQPGFSASFRDFAIRFAGKWVPGSTGHGIDVTPPFNGTYYDNGVMDSLWQNLFVYGNDGNHYGYNLVNPLLDTFVELQSVGGGLINLQGSGLLEYGNVVLIHPYGTLIVPGSAQGIHMWSTNLYINKITLVRPQVNSTVAPALAGYPAPRLTQFQTSTTGTTAALVGITFIAGDFEGPAGTSFPSSSANSESIATMGGNAALINSVPTSGTCYQNTAASMAAIAITYVLAPTSSAAATVTFQGSSNSSCTSPATEDQISAPTGNYVSTLSAATGTSSGTTTLSITALAQAIPAGSIVVTSGSNSQVFTTPGAAASATTLTITSATPNFNYPSGATIAASPLTGTVRAFIYPGNYYVVTYTNAVRVASAVNLVPSA